MNSFTVWILKKWGGYEGWAVMQKEGTVSALPGPKIDKTNTWLPLHDSERKHTQNPDRRSTEPDSDKECAQ